jgi:hypothetical protein
MSNDTPDTPDNADAARAQAEDFTSTPWTVMVGIRQTPDPANPGNLVEGLMFGMVVSDAAAMVSTPHGMRPDTTNEAIHFARWFDQHKQFIVGLWRENYVQYMNLKRLSERGLPGLRIVGADEQPAPIVGADGKALQ